MEVRIVMRESLENVNVGDMVIRQNRYGEMDIVEVIRVTKTQIAVEGGSRYRKADGGSIGTGIWDRTCIFMPVKGEVERLKKKQFIRDVASRMKRVNMNTISYEQAVKIKEVLGL